MEKQLFCIWLTKNTTLSDSSIGKYSAAIGSISKDMLGKKLITGNIYLMTPIELDIYVPLILNDVDFLAKDTKGNHMYSSALKHFRMYRKATEDILADDLSLHIRNYDKITETEKKQLVKARIGQGDFRDKIIAKYDSKCIVTGISDQRLLIASHIKPWAVCNNIERLSAENGLLLSPLYDKLFDCGLMTFTKDGRLHLSSRLNPRDISRFKTPDCTYFDLKISNDLVINLEYHQDVIFVK